MSKKQNFNYKKQKYISKQQNFNYKKPYFKDKKRTFIDKKFIDKQQNFNYKKPYLKDKQREFNNKIRRFKYQKGGFNYKKRRFNYKKKRGFNFTKKGFQFTDADLSIKKIARVHFNIIKFIPLDVQRYKIIRTKRRKKEIKSSRRPFSYRLVLSRFINGPIKKFKKKKRSKNLHILRWLHKNNSKKKFFKKLHLMQKVFMQYYGNISYFNFKRVNLAYSLYNNLTKFEKFFYYFEFRLPTIVVRIKFVRNYYQAVKYVTFGGLCVNGVQISYTNFLTNLFDLIELAYRFYRYGYSKRYIIFKEYRSRIRRRAYFLRYFKRKQRKTTRWFLKKLFNYGGKKPYFLSRANRFFEKNRRIVSVILIRSFYKYKQRKFNKYFSFKNLSLLMSFNKK
jgi:ribosomal protein S4